MMAIQHLWLDAQQWGLTRLDRIAQRRGRTEAPHLESGLRGERAALFELRRRGYLIVAERWTTARARGDVDLIAWHGQHLCFIEIKTRASRNISPAEAAVDEDKRRQLRRLARAYLSGLPPRERPSIPIRFDVVSVYLLQDSAEFDLFEAAFTSS